MIGGCSKIVDSNIWIYALSDDDEPKAKKAASLIRSLEGEIGFTAQIVNETCLHLKRKSKLSEAEVRRIIFSFFLHHRFIDVSETVMVSASTLRERYKFSFWDSMIVASGIEVGADTLYSEDMQDGLIVEGTLTIKNPFHIS